MTSFKIQADDNFNTIGQTLINDFENIVMQQNVKPAIDRSIKDLAFVAQEMSPEKTGSLERAIVENKSLKQSDFVASGEVKIDDSAYNQEEQVYVSEYAEEAHDMIEPYGPKKLGKGSVEKSNRTDKIVGGGFMTRALEYLEDNIVDEIFKNTEKGLSQM